MEMYTPIQISGLRLKSEKIYFLLVCGVSLLFWGWLIMSSVWSLVFPPAPVFPCFIRDPETYDLYEVEDVGDLEEEETCVAWSELSAGEREELASSVEIPNLLSELTTLLIVVGILLLSFFFHLFAIAFIRANGVRVGPNQFPRLFEKAQAFSSRLCLKKQPDMFLITGEGALNAFAAKLVRRRIIVFYSDLAEALLEGEDTRQLEAVLSHELAHHALGHTNLWNWLIAPGEVVPFLGSALSRAREYSADRVMKTVVPDGESCERALIKLSVGKRFGNETNAVAFVEQGRDEHDFFVWLAEKLSSHPHLPKRIAALRAYKEGQFLAKWKSASIGD